MYENISERKYVDLFCSVFNKFISGSTTPYFQNVSGVAQHLIFHELGIPTSLFAIVSN